MKTPTQNRQGPTWFTVYQDRFVIVYFLVLALYLLLGFLIFFLPIADPGGGHRNLPRIGLLIVPASWLVVVTGAVMSIALRASWALKFYPRAARYFFVILIITSLITFLRLGFGISIFITVALLIFCLPLLLVMRSGVRYLKRSDVRESFAQAQSARDKS